jgi:hypothetical protein
VHAHADVEARELRILQCGHSVQAVGLNAAWLRLHH